MPAASGPDMDIRHETEGLVHVQVKYQPWATPGRMAEPDSGPEQRLENIS